MSATKYKMYSTRITRRQPTCSAPSFKKNGSVSIMLDYDKKGNKSGSMDEEVCPMDFVSVELGDDFDDQQNNCKLSVTSKHCTYPSTLASQSNGTTVSSIQEEDPPESTLRLLASTFPTSCHECHQEFGNRIDFLVHREFTHGENVLAQDYNGAICSECGQLFKMPIRLLGHMKVYHARDLEREEAMKNHLNFPYVCHFCPTGYHTKSDLKMHANKFHKKRFKGKAQIQMMTHRFTCESCNVKYRLAHVYRMHLETTHPNLYTNKKIKRAK